ncbi:MAG: MFS transporter [Candidatus Methanoliparum thermophilum]|uniref:MFS transporter n=1 Tax=Methanoliparum thermophilum TaxID=2491083 RepID=A0A520KU21_METT2|nr:MFS transporter [Candidatus Methanoliparum sp. LAM-1]RZN65617.1 MAG: MFS transporter [Candidatus Methanoliparum thermophilum]BDC36495.1 hypothetical protein MTLP_11770 [Candidatus Methanoliparum sp. LAM-1]
MKNKKIIFVFASMFATSVGMGLLTPFISLYSKLSFNATGIWLGIIFSGFSISKIITTPFIGFASDKKSKKKVLQIGAILYSFIPFAYMYADTIYTLLIVRLLHGFSSAFMTPIIIAYLGDISPKGEEGRYMALLNLPLFLGAGIGPFLGGILIDREIRYLFYLMEIFFLTILLMTSLFPDIKKSGISSVQNYSITQSLKDHKTLILIVFGFLNSLSRCLIIFFVPIFAYISLNLDGYQIGAIFSLATITSFLLQYPFGMASDRLPKLGLILLGSFIYTFTLFLMPFSRYFWDLLFLTLIFNIGNALTAPASMGAATIIGKDLGVGTTVGLVDTSMSIGMIVGPILAGVIMDLSSIERTFYLIGMMNIIGLIVIYLLKAKLSENRNF